MKRNEIFDAWKSAHVMPDQGLELRTDDAVERLYFEWLKEGSPQYAYVAIEAVSTPVVIAGLAAPELE